MKNLLHVDDDASWRFNFEDLAGDLGLKLSQFSTQDEALAAIREKKPDIVVTDLHIGEKDGDRLAGYKIARVAQEAGVPYITIASETETPSQEIKGVSIQGKREAMVWLKQLVKGGPERE